MYFYLLYIYLPTSDSFSFSSLRMLYPFTPTLSLMLLRQLLNRFESRHLSYFIVFSTFVACRTDIQTPYKSFYSTESNIHLFYCCKIRIFGSNLILRERALNYIHQYLIFKALIYAQLNRCFIKKELYLFSILIPFHETIHSGIPLESPP